MFFTVNVGSGKICSLNIISSNNLEKDYVVSSLDNYL